MTVFFNDSEPSEIYTYCHTLSLHGALPISDGDGLERHARRFRSRNHQHIIASVADYDALRRDDDRGLFSHLDSSMGIHPGDRKSTRLNSSHYCASRMPSHA